jgi:hypothetical protein
MADQPSTSLSYGVLGHAAYSSDEGKWSFSRRPGRRNILYPISAPEIIINSPQASSQKVDGTRNPVKKQIKHLLRANPELAPAASVLPFLAQASQTITNLTAIFDPHVSTVFDIGLTKVYKEDGIRTMDRKVAAVVAGETGNCLRFYLLDESRASWSTGPTPRFARSQSGKTGLGVFRLLTKHPGWWVGSGGPIQQICFATVDSKQTDWLAVRTPNRTVILRVTVRSQARRTNQETFSHGHSQVTAEVLFTISTDMTGGLNHTDVAFNPWSKDQIAVIDELGSFKVYRAEGFQTLRWKGKAKLSSDGSLGTNEDKTPSTRNEGHGWAKVIWAGDGSTIIACTRRSIAMFDIRESVARSPPSYNMNILGADDLILDLKASLQHSGIFYILTSSELVLMQAVCSSSKNRSKKAGLYSLLSWKHHRHPEDISLQLHITEFDDRSTVLIYSKLNHITTCYQFSITSDTSIVASSISDPYQLPLLEATEKESLQSSMCPPHLSCMFLMRLSYVSGDNNEFQSLSKRYMDQNIPFFQLFTIFNDLSVRSCLYSSGIMQTPDITVESDIAGSSLINAPDTLHKKKLFTFQSATIVDDDDFIVDSDLDPFESDITNPRTSSADESNARDIPIRSRLSNRISSKANPGFADLLFSRLQGFLDDRLGMSHETISILEYGQMLRNIISTQIDAGHNVFDSIAHICPPPSFSEDLEYISQYLSESLRSNLEEMSRYESEITIEIQLCLSPDLQNLFADSSTDDIQHVPSLQQIYATLEQQRYRQASNPDILEEQLKYLATRFYLGCLRIRVKPQYGLSPIKTALQSLSANQDPEDRISQYISSNPLRSSQRMSLSTESRPVALEFSRAAEQAQNYSSQGSVVSTAPTTGDDTGEAVIQRLRTYTKVEPPLLLGKTIQRMLTHWVVGKDPVTYSYSTVSRTSASGSEGGTLSGAESAVRVIRKRRPGELSQLSRSNPSRPQSQTGEGAVDDLSQRHNLSRATTRFGNQQPSGETFASFSQSRAGLPPRIGSSQTTGLVRPTRAFAGSSQDQTSGSLRQISRLKQSEVLGSSQVSMLGRPSQPQVGETSNRESRNVGAGTSNYSQDQTPSQKAKKKKRKVGF